jgi:hypothetical protein
MSQGWRGFGRERHGTLKAALAGLAVVGFAASWLGFASSHPPVDQPTSEAAAAALATASAVPPTRTAAPAGPSATATIAANPTEPLPTYTRPKRSRGS